MLAVEIVLHGAWLEGEKDPTGDHSIVVGMDVGEHGGAPGWECSTLSPPLTGCQEDGSKDRKTRPSKRLKSSKSSGDTESKFGNNSLELETGDSAGEIILVFSSSRGGEAVACVGES